MDISSKFIILGRDPTKNGFHVALQYDINDINKCEIPYDFSKNEEEVREALSKIIDTDKKWLLIQRSKFYFDESNNLYLTYVVQIPINIKFKFNDIRWVSITDFGNIELKQSIDQQIFSEGLY